MVVAVVAGFVVVVAGFVVVAAAAVVGFVGGVVVAGAVVAVGAFAVGVVRVAGALGGGVVGGVAVGGYFGGVVAGCFDGELAGFVVVDEVVVGEVAADGVDEASADLPRALRGRCVGLLVPAEQPFGWEVDWVFDWGLEKGARVEG